MYTKTTYERAMISGIKREPVATALTEFFDRYLKSKNNDNNIALATKGKRIACSLDIFS